MNAITTTKQPGLIAKMASARNVDADAFYKAVKNVIMPPQATTEQTLAFLLVADRYGLDPMLKEIHCFLDKRTQNIVPMISIDGWAKMMNNHPAFDGVEFEFHKNDEGLVEAISCRIFRKDRSRPYAVTEFLDECYRETDPWKKTPTRMLRHRALIQCIRIAFGFSGSFSEDDQPETVGPVISHEAAGEPQRAIEAPAAAKPAGTRRPPPAPSGGSNKQDPRQNEERDQRRGAEDQREPEQPSQQQGTSTVEIDPETGEILEDDAGNSEFDGDGFLTELGEAYSTATSFAELDGIFNDWRVGAQLASDPARLKRAAGIYDRHHRRITAANA